MGILAPERRTHRDGDGEGSRPRRLRAIGIGALVAAMSFVAGVLATGWRSPTATPATKSSASAVAAPTKLVNGIPLGWPHSEAGAIGAAVDLDPVVQQYALGQVSGAPAAAAGAPTDDSSELKSYGYSPGPTSRLLLTESPLMYRVDSYTPDTAAVDVWSVELEASVPGNSQSLTALWVTVKVTIVWQGDDWKFESATPLAPGPVPATGNQAFPTGAQEAIAAMDGFQPYISTAKGTQP